MMQEVRAPVFSVAIGKDLELVYGADECTDPEPYPSSALQKGLILRSREAGDLTQEGVGFGVPVLKTGISSVFPGRARVASADQERGLLSVEYEMCLVDRLVRPGSGRVIGGLVDSAKEIAAAVHRRIPLFRALLSGFSRTVRAAAGLTTSFVLCRSAGVVRVDYEASCAGSATAVSVLVDASSVDVQGLTRIAVMNELGADHFSRFVDSDGNLFDGESIGTWNRVDAARATFIDRVHDIAFSVRACGSAGLFRGRERVADRLAWAGFGYLLPAGARSFSYEVHITPSGAHQWRESF